MAVRVVFYLWVAICVNPYYLGWQFNLVMVAVGQVQGRAVELTVCELCQSLFG